MQENTAICCTRGISRGPQPMFSEWTEVINLQRLPAVLLDGFARHVYILEMKRESYRL